MPFKRGDIVQHADGSLYVVTESNSVTFYTNTLIELAPGFEATDHEDWSQVDAYFSRVGRIDA